jgi:uncharacterized protein YndB with AHSA1/START domain
VRMEDRFETDIEAAWSALTDASRLAHWYGRVEGDLRPGAEFHAHLDSLDWDGRDAWRRVNLRDGCL